MVPEEQPDESLESDSSSDGSSTGVPENAVAAKLLETKIPLPNKIRLNLQRAHKELQPAHREAVIQSFVHYSLTDKKGLTSPGNQYLLKRLITGVSTSVGCSRQNYATILMRLTKAHAKFDKKAFIADTVFAVVVQVYGGNGSFKADYMRGLLDKTLGTLAATSAIVRGARGSKMSLETARQIVRVLRQAVSGAAHKWCLAPAVIDVLRELLDSVMKRKDMQPLAKLLWRWAEDRKNAHDGLTLALLMRLEYNIMTQDAFTKLYTSIADLSTPLIAMFETGFPIEKKSDPEGPQMEFDDLPEVSVSSRGCPLVWALTLKYLSTNHGRKHLGGISAFWNEFVTPSLQIFVHSVEKKILVRSMLPISIALCNEDEPQEAVLSNLTLNVCTQSLFTHAVKKNHGNTRARATVDRLRQLWEELPAELMSLCASNKQSESRRAFMAEYIVRWVAENKGLGRPLDVDRLIANIPEAVPSSMVDRFFSRLLHCYLFSVSPSLKCLEMSRASYLKVLNRTISEHPDLEPLLIHVCITASIFCPTNAKEFEARKRVAGGKIRLKPVPESFENAVEKMQNELSTNSFTTLLPTASPPFQDKCAIDCFSRLQEILLKALNARKVADRVKFAVKLLDNTLKNTEKLNIKLRSKLSLSVDDPRTPACFKALRKSIEQLDVEQSSISGVHECLALVGGFLQILFFDHQLTVESEQFAGLEKLSILVCDAANKLTSKSTSKKKQDSPSALEQTVLLLCTMCSESETLASVARAGIGLLGQSADDSVTPVLFDLLEAARKEETEDDFEADSGDEEDDGDDEDDDEAFLEINADINDTKKSEKENENASEDDADAMKDDTPANRNGDVKMTNAENDEDTDILDADIDPDTEDPAVLDAFDKHLSNHMKLLTEKRVNAKKKKTKLDSQIIRILNLIGAFANSLRLRIERKNEKVDKKTVAIFFDVFVRFAEFICSEEFDASKYAKHVAPICSKLLSRNKILVDGLAGLDIITEFASRLFSALTKSLARGRSIHVLSPTIRRMFVVILETHVTSYKKGQSDLIKLYKDLWGRCLKMKTLVSVGEVFSDFAESFPEESIAMTDTAFLQFGDKERSDADRRHAVKGMEIVRKAALALHKEKPALSAKYWDAMYSMVDSFSSDDHSNVWKSEQSVRAMLVVLRDGESAQIGERVTDSLDKLKQLAAKQGFHKIEKELASSLKRPHDQLEKPKSAEKGEGAKKPRLQ